MDFLLINNNKLKIKLNRNDIENLGMDFHSNGLRDSQMKRMLWQVLDIASAECGFIASGNRLLLQFFPYDDGGEIFVTKIGRCGTGIERSIARSQNVAMLCSKHIVCRIIEIEGLIKLCRCLSEEALENTARLYYSDDENLYLIYDERDGGAVSELDRIFEFADAVPLSMEQYILEHSVNINESEKALRLLSEL